MNIPSLIVSQHEREKTHRFACEENGFVNLGVYRPGGTERAISEGLERLVEDHAFRRRLLERMSAFTFRGNKEKVVGLLLGVLRSGGGPR
jgi:hypothetical protein